MGLVKAALLTLISVAFVAAGVFILMRDPANAALAWGVIAFFGACSLVGALQLLPKRRAIRSDDTELVLQPGRLHFAGMAIGAVAMAIGCFLLAPAAWADGERLTAGIGYFGAAFFGLGGLMLTWRTLFPQPIARLDATGVRTYGPGAWHLSWREISSIGVYEVEAQRMILLKSNTRPPPLLSPMGFSFSAQGTGFVFEDVLAFANALWAQHRGT